MGESPLCPAVGSRPGGPMPRRLCCWSYPHPLSTRTFAIGSGVGVVSQDCPPFLAQPDGRGNVTHFRSTGFPGCLLICPEGKETTRDKASGYGIDNETEGFEGNRPQNSGIARLPEDHGRDGLVCIHRERGHAETSSDDGTRCRFKFAFRPARFDPEVRQHLGGQETDRGPRLHEQIQPGRTSRLCRMRDRDSH